MIRFITVVLILCPLVALTQPCADWPETMPPPIGYPDVMVDDMLAIDGLLVSVRNTIEVRDLAATDLPVVGSCPAPASSYQRLREAGGVVYLVTRDEGIWRVGLVDPTQPTCEPFLAMEGDLRDIVGIPGGLVVATEAGSCRVFDTSGAPLAEFDLGASISSGDASGATACFVGEAGLVTVDLSDASAPIVGVPAFCEPDVPWPGFIDCPQVSVAGDHAYAALTFDWPSAGIRQHYLQRFDIADPLNPVADVCVAVEEQHGGTLATASGILFSTQYSVEVRSPETLELVAAAMIPASIRSLLQLEAAGDDVLALSIDHQLWRLDISAPATVAPVATRPYGYDPSGCGRFGLRSWGRSDQFGWGEFNIEIHDQSDPSATSLVFEEQLVLTEADMYTPSIPVQNEHWAVLRINQHHGDGWGQDWEATTYLAVDPAGNSYPVGSAWSGLATLAGNRFWFLGGNPYQPDVLQAFDLSSDVPVAHTPLGIEQYGHPVVVGDRLLIVTNEQIDILDVSDPDLPTPVAVFDPDLSFDLHGIPPLLDDRTLFAPTTTGVAVIDVTDELLVLRSVIELGHAPAAMEKSNEVLAVSVSSAWSLVDVADLDQPVVRSTTAGVAIDGLVLTEDKVYVGTRGSVQLYDAGDPATPSWLGQAEAVAWSQGGVCRSGDLILDGHRVFPIDCSDVVSIDDDDDGPLPEAIPTDVTLYQPSPSPFNPRTSIDFDLTRRTHATVTVHDLRGRTVATLGNAPYGAGHHRLTWDGTDARGHALPSGTYLVRLVTDSDVRTAKAVLIR